MQMFGSTFLCCRCATSLALLKRLLLIKLEEPAGEAVLRIDAVLFPEEHVDGWIGALQVGEAYVSSVG